MIISIGSKFRASALDNNRYKIDNYNHYHQIDGSSRLEKAQGQMDKRIEELYRYIFYYEIESNSKKST